MVGLVHPRSGLAARAGLSIVNSPGTIDAGYRGEVKVALINLDPATPIAVHRGDRIAQLLVQRFESVALIEVASFNRAGLAETSRGDGGHGSSGGHASL
jgi:dUTP pyrophosphatase